MRNVVVIHDRGIILLCSDCHRRTFLMIRVLQLDYFSEHYEWTRVQLQKLSNDVELDFAQPSKVLELFKGESEYDCVLIDDQVLDNGSMKYLNPLREGGLLIPTILLTDRFPDGGRDFKLRALWDDEFNVMIAYARYDLLNYWIHRLVDSYKMYKIIGKLRSELYKDEPFKAETAKELEKRLTRREREVLKMISKGHSNKEIADALGISYRTAVNHVHNLFGKLNVRSRAEAVYYSVSMKLAVDE